MADYLTPDQRRRISTGLMAAQYDKPIPSPVDLSHLDGQVVNRSELMKAVSGATGKRLTYRCNGS